MSDEQRATPEAEFIERDEVAVMFTQAADNPEAIGRAWVELEQTIGSLRGRRFFGSFDPASGEYRACVQIRDGDDADALGLKIGKLAGGRYLRVRLHGQPPAIYESIAPTFEKLAGQAEHDPSRPSIEFYRQRDRIDLLLPVP